MSVEKLITAWHEDAERLKAYGAEAAAVAVLECASQLQTAVDLWRLEALTIAEAAAHSGYSDSSIQKKIASGELQNVGAKNKPRVRRGDLPVKNVSARVTSSLADRILRKAS